MLALRDVRLIPTWIGALAGVVAFAAVGAVTGLLYGGYAGLAMAGLVTGTPVEPTVLVKMITLGGMALGVFASFFFFTVMGAVVGTLAGVPFAPVLQRWANRLSGKYDADVGDPRQQPAAR